MIVSEDELIGELEGLEMERQLITGIAADKNDAKVTLTRIADRPGAVATIFGPLAEANINVDMIIQNVAKDKGETDVTFTVPQADLARTQALLEEQKDTIGYYRIIADSKVAKISVVGVGMRSHAGVAGTMFKALADRGINIQAISTSEIKVSVLIDEDETELAVRVLHTAYGRDAAYRTVSESETPPPDRGDKPEAGRDPTGSGGGDGASPERGSGFASC
jgi:aspartate kinase